jgi:hypothetical protein
MTIIIMQFSPASSYFFILSTLSMMQLPPRFTFNNLDLSISVIIGYWLHGPRFESRKDREIFLFSKTFGLALGPAQPPI